MAQSTTHTSIDPATHIGALSLRVADLERSVQFYSDVLGFRILKRENEQAVLGVAQTPLLRLGEQRGVRPRPQHTTGLYHFAILVPTRADLGRSLRQLAVTRYPLGGYADHLVSEALYLTDPDGNGIEIYRDRPRDTWQWDNGQVRMASDPIDLDGLVAEAGDAPWSGLAAGTIIGHMHLQIGDVAQAEAFYHGVLGFDVVARWPGALFVGAGGYHHHLGLNTWHSRNAPPQPADAAGLELFMINVGDQAALGQVRERLEAANIMYTDRDQSVVLHDPWHNCIVVTTGDGMAAITIADEMINGSSERKG